jgi:hypothetical protein
MMTERQIREAIVERLKAINGSCNIGTFITMTACSVGFIPVGWEIAPALAYHRPVQAAGALMPWYDGIDTLRSFFQFGWPILLPQPPHPRPERAGAFLVGHPGIEAKYVFVPPPVQPV